MAETGIEDLAREPLSGCLGTIVPAIVFVVILFVVLGLISAYCGSSKGDEQPPTENTR